MIAFTSTGPSRRSDRFVRTISLSAILVAGAVLLIGWPLDIGVLKSVVPGLAIMKAETAMGLVLGGVALWLLRTEAAGRTARIVGQGAAMTLSGIALFSLGQAVFGVNLGIDPLLARGVPGQPAISDRMSTMTACNFVLLGPSLFLLGVRRGWGPTGSQILAMMLAATSMLGLIGHLYGPEALYQVEPYGSMALHTAATLLLLAFGVWLARPHLGIASLLLTDAIEGVIVRRIWPVTVAAFLVFSVLRAAAVRAGMIPDDFGIALMIWGGLVMFSAVICWSTATISKAKAAASRQREWLEVTLSSIGDGVIATDRQGRVAFVNQIALDLTGWSERDAIGQPSEDIFRIFEEDRRATIPSPAQRAIRENVIVSLGGRNVLVVRDGTVRGVDDSAAPIRDGQGHVTGAVVVFRDVTERRRADDQLRAQASLLRQSEEQLRSFFESASVGMALTDLDGKALRVNDACCRITGYRREDLLGRSCHDLTHPDDRQADEAHFRVMAQGQQPVYDVERRCVRASGEAFWCHTIGTAIRDDRGRMVAIAVVIEDISDRKRAEQARAAADRQKDQFLAMLAHELRNPLAALESGLALLDATRDSEERDWALGMSTRQVRHLARMVDDLLETSRVTRGTIRLRMARIQPSKVIGHAIEIFRQRIEDRGIALRVSMASDLPEVDADPTRLEQVVSNLLGNANKYTPPGGRIEVSVVVDGESLSLSIRDTGFGIDPEFLPRVFDLFAQADTSLARERGGLGLGLTLVKRIVELHGGSVEAHSDGPGRGSTFVVRQPIRRRRASDASENGADNPRPSPESARAPRSTRVLMVEDNVEYAGGIERLLKRAGFEVRIARDGPSALDMVRRWIPDVVLLDLGLPCMDGFEVARRLREDDRLARTMIVVISGYADEIERQRSRELGIDAHLAKPVAFRDLLRTINGDGSDVMPWNDPSSIPASGNEAARGG